MAKNFIINKFYIVLLILFSCISLSYAAQNSQIYYSDQEVQDWANKVCTHLFTIDPKHYDKQLHLLLNQAMTQKAANKYLSAMHLKPQEHFSINKNLSANATIMNLNIINQQWLNNYYSWQLALELKQIIHIGGIKNMDLHETVFYDIKLTVIQTLVGTGNDQRAKLRIADFDIKQVQKKNS